MGLASLQNPKILIVRRLMETFVNNVIKDIFLLMESVWFKTLYAEQLTCQMVDV